MKTSILPVDRADASSDSTSWASLDRLAKRMVLSLLREIETGQLTLADGKELYTFGRPSALFPWQGVMAIHHRRFYRKVLWGGSIGAAEAYMAGDWSAKDLTVVIRLMAINRHIFERMDRGWGRVRCSIVCTTG